MGSVKSFAKRKGTVFSGWPRGLGGPPSHDLLAIDPGTCTGWAIFKEQNLRGCGIGDPPVEWASCVVIELPQIYPHQPVPPNDLVTLAFLAGRYAGRASGEVMTVFPHQWKGNLPKDVCAARIRLQLSPHELKIIDDCGVTAKQMHNVMDAIGIGLDNLNRQCYTLSANE